MEKRQIYLAADRYVKAGLNIIPCSPDGKRPAVNSWAQYQTMRVNPNVLMIWFQAAQNRVAIICGAISGNLELLDFDDNGSAFERWRALVEQHKPGLIARLVIETSPRGGVHVVYRCSDAVIPGNQKLANKLNTATGEIQVLIETRGEGGYFLCAPNDGYRLKQGAFENVQNIDSADRETLHWAARQLNEVPDEPVKPPVVKNSLTSQNDVSPADDYNAKHSFRDLLEKHGWKFSYTRGDRDYYLRPGKDLGEISADVLKDEVFFVFSTNAHPFKAQQGYSKFQAYTILEHGGDMSAASVEVMRQRPPDNVYRPVMTMESPDPPNSTTFNAITAWRAAVQSGRISADRHEETIETLSTRQPMRFSELREFNVWEDENNLIGDRFLSRGGGMLITGETGAGKSSLNLQMAACFAMGQNFFGMTPVKALKSIIIQSENDRGDIAEEIQGVIAGLGITDCAAINDRILIYEESMATGDEFCKELGLLASREKPDLIFIDPFISFLGDDVCNQKAVSRFLRNQLNPILKRAGAAVILVHHVGKPSNDPRARRSDLYGGIGTSDIQNWARAIMSLKAIDADTFELIASKRGKRAGLDGEGGKQVFIKHAARGIFWELALMPEKQIDKKVENKIDDAEQLSAVISVLKNSEPLSYIELAQLVIRENAVSIATAKRRISEWKKAKYIRCDAAGLYSAI